MLAIVLNSDYGSLGELNYLVRDVGVRTVLLMPQRLYATVKGTVDVPHAEYSRLSDVCEILHQIKATSVILGSAYLYGLNKLLAPYETLRLLEFLEVRGMRVAVNDPFAGYWSNFDAMRNLADLRHSRMAAIAELVFLSRQLARYPHLYPYAPGTPVDRPVQPFFNPAIGLDAARATRLVERAAQALGREPGAYWFYFLSTVEYDKLCSHAGADGALRTIGARLGDAARNDRDAVLVAPNHCIDGLRRMGVGAGRLQMFPHCGFETFRGLIWCAEFVFSWNALSFSVLERLYNGRPVFFLDRGHFYDFLPSLHEHVRARWYPDCELPLLDPQKAVAADTLDACWQRTGPALVRGYRASIEGLPRADAVVASLAGDG